MLTSVTDHRPLATVTLFATWFSLARGWIAQLAREIQLRHAMRRLASLDDAMLHDVGLARSGIEDAVRHGRARAGLALKRTGSEPRTQRDEEADTSAHSTTPKRSSHAHVAHGPISTR